MSLLRMFAYRRYNALVTLVGIRLCQRLVVLVFGFLVLALGVLLLALCDKIVLASTAFAKLKYANLMREGLAKREGKWGVEGGGGGRM